MAYNGLNEPILLFVVGANGTLVPAAGLQPGYGPHSSLSNARTTLTEIFKSISNVPQGYTFCVIEDNAPVEYWFIKSGGWYVEKKCKSKSTSDSDSSSSSSSQQNQQPTGPDLTAFQIKIFQPGGILKYTFNGKDWKEVGTIDPSGTIDNIVLKIDEESGNLYISYNGNDGPWVYVGYVGGESTTSPQTKVRFTTGGVLQVSYDGGTTWEDIVGIQYQGNKISETEFQRLLQRFLKFDLDENSYLKVSYDGGSSFSRIAKSCTCQDTEDSSGLYRLKIRVRDADTQATISGAEISITDALGNTTVGSTTQWLEPGTYTVEVSCVGYHPDSRIVTLNNDNEVIFNLTADTSVPMSYISVTPVEEDGVTAINPSRVKIYIGAQDGLKERSAAWVKSGEIINIKIVGNDGSGYGRVEVSKKVESSDNYLITVPFASQEPEVTWKYFVMKKKIQDAPIPNIGRSAMGVHINAYRTNTVTGEHEQLTFVRAYNADGDPGVECTGTYAISSSDPEYLSYGSIGLIINYPAAEKQYLHYGYIYKMKADFEDSEGRTVTTSWDVYYEGFWEYIIEKYNQIDYPDATDGGIATIRVDSYCVADEECPDVDPDNNERYACPITIDSKTGVSVSSGYPTRVYTGNGVTGGRNFDTEYSSSSPFVENYRNIIELALTQDPHTISGNALINDILSVPITIVQSGTQHYPLPGTASYMLSHSDDGYISDDVYVDTRVHTLYFESDSLTVEAFGRYSSRSSQAYWNGNGEFKKSLLVAYSGEKASVNANDSFFGATIRVLGSNSAVVYQGTIDSSGSVSENTNSDGYLTTVHIYRMKELYTNSSGTHNRYTNKIGIQLRHTMNYNPDREYTIDILHENGGKHITTTWTLLQESLVTGKGVYPNQALPEEEGSVGYFGVYGDIAASAVKLIPLDYRSNWADTVIEKVNSVPSGWQVNPMHKDDTVAWFAQGEEPIRVPNASAVSWFKVTCPAIPNEPGDVEKTRRFIEIYYDDGSALAATNNIVFIGQQGNTY